MADQPEWVYSTEALNVLDKFHEASYIVYVEGEDDINFWSCLFQKAGQNGQYLEFAGGIEELQKIMEQIVNEGAKVIVACDSHYSRILGYHLNHEQIIRTFGYSIENTMYCPCILNDAVNKLSRKIEDRIKTIQEWFNTFCDSAKILLIFDLANAIRNGSIGVIGDKCNRFLNSARSSRLDGSKIADYISVIKGRFTKKELKNSEELIDRCGQDIRYVIKGSFFTGGIINLIKNTVKRYTGKRPTMSLDNLYALLCNGCITCSDKCSDFGFVQNQIQKAVASVRLI